MDLKPCPFCGAPEDELNVQEDMVWCGRCDAAGPGVPYEKDALTEAIAKWNERE